MRVDANRKEQSPQNENRFAQHKLFGRMQCFGIVVEVRECQVVA